MNFLLWHENKRIRKLAHSLITCQNGPIYKLCTLSTKSYINVQQRQTEMKKRKKRNCSPNKFRFDCNIPIMMRSQNMRNSKKVARLANRARKISQDAFLSDLYKGMYKAYIKNNNRLPYQHLENILNKVR